MVGIYVTEECPNLTKEQAAELLKLDAKTLDRQLSFLIHYGNVEYFSQPKKSLSNEDKIELEELSVMCAQIYKKVKDYYVENNLFDPYNVDMNFMRMLLDFVYLNCELAYSNNQQLDLAAAVKTYSTDNETIKKIVCRINKSAKERFYDIYEANRMPTEWKRVCKEVDEVYNKLLQDIGLAKPVHVSAQPGSNE